MVSPPCPRLGAALRTALGCFPSRSRPAPKRGAAQPAPVLLRAVLPPCKASQETAGALWRQGQCPPLRSGWRRLGTSRGYTPALDAPTQGLASILVVRCSVTAPPWGGGPASLWTSVAGIARAAQARSRLAGLAWSGTPFGGSAPPNPCQPKRIVVQSVFYWPGCVPRLGTPWKASHGRGGVGGGQARGPLPWPTSGRCCSSCWKAPQCTLRSLLRQGPGARALPMAAPWGPALTPAPFAWASPRSRKNKNCSDQPLNGQGSVAHVLAHPLFGGHGKPSHPCVSLQHTALRKIPWNRHAFFVLKPHTTGRQP
jgi:hypothetical protein